MEPTQNSETSRAERWHRKAQRALMSGDLSAAGRACTRLIEIDPNNAEAYFIAAVCTLEGGYPADALMGFEKATSLDANRADYWAQQARCLTVLGRNEEARTSANRAIDLPISDAVTHNTLGIVLTRINQHAEALPQYESAARLVPENAQYHYHLGTSLTSCGELDRGEAALERALEIDPDHSRAHLALSEMLNDSPPPGRIEGLEAALGRASDDLDGGLVISQALARTLEATGETARAFTVWEQSKNAKKQAVSYTIDEDRPIFSAFHELFSEKQDRDQRPGNPSEAPIFVVGMPRTGTTLVERILASHPAIVAGGELTSFPHSILEASGGQTTGLIDIDSLGAALDADPADIGSSYLEKARAVIGDPERFVDKLSLNFFLIGFIRQALPKARIVCLHRNPLDTCVANFRQLFALGFPYYRHALSLTDTAEYYAMFSRLISHWDKQQPGQMHHVQYEKLVTDPESEIRPLFEHIELEIVPEVLDFDGSIDQSSVHSWRRYEKEVEPLKRRLAELGIDAGLTEHLGQE